MLFGWFYLPVVIALHFGAWFAWPWYKGRGLGRISFSLIGALVGAVIFAVIGVKEVGNILHFTVAYAIAAALPAFVSCMIIATLHDTKQTSDNNCVPT